MFLVAGGTMTSCIGVVSQAVPAATSQVLWRPMRSSLKTVCASKKMSNKVILTILLSFFSNIKSDVVTNKHKWSPELDGGELF